MSHPSMSVLAALLLVPAVGLADAPVPTPPANAAAVATWKLPARIVAVGLPGVAGVRQIGRFHAGGPIPGNPEFLLQTDPGRVLDPQRLMVAVADNLGAPRAGSAERAGAILSIDPRGTAPLVVPRDFAARGGQASALDGAVRLYSAQSRAVPQRPLQRRRPHGRRRGDLGAALHLDQQRLRPAWIANAPLGVDGAGSLSVVDPDGAPLANAPSDDAGGVFLGAATARRQSPRACASTIVGKAFNYRDSAQLTPGALASGALGTAFLGASPDGSGLAVFAVATADGAIAQVHVQDGVDGLAPAGTVRRSDDDGGVIGMAFQWNPDRVLYVADAGATGSCSCTCATTSASSWSSAERRRRAAAAPAGRPRAGRARDRQRRASPATRRSPAAPTSTSSIAATARSCASISDGTVLARAVIDLPGGAALGAGRLRAIAVSADAQRLWLTLQGDVPGFAGREGALIEVSAFDAAGAFGAATGR